MVLRMYEIPGSHVDISVHGSSDKVLAFPGPVESTRAVARVLGHLLTYIINLASAEQKKKKAYGFGGVRREVHMRSSRVPGFEIRKDEEQVVETTLSFNGKMKSGSNNNIQVLATP